MEFDRVSREAVEEMLDLNSARLTRSASCVPVAGDGPVAGCCQGRYDRAAAPVHTSLIESAHLSKPKTGLTFLVKAGGGLYWLVPAAVASLLGGVVNAWLFLVKVTR
jgi:hypothetical protein